MARTVSSDGLSFIVRHEGRVMRNGLHILYNDPAGHATIGYGHLVHRGPIDGTERADFKAGLTEAQARDLLDQDLDSREAAVNRLPVELSQEQFDAIVSFVFNAGGIVLDPKESTFARLLLAGDYEGAAGQFRRWVKATKPDGTVVTLEGLVTRRQEEERLFRSGIPKETPVSEPQILLMAKHSRLVLDVASRADGTHDPGARLVQNGVHGLGNQRLMLEDVGNGEVRIRVASSGLVLDVVGNGSENGSEIQTWYWHGGANQRWKLNAKGDGLLIESVGAPGKVLDVAHAAKGMAAPIQLWDANDGDHQVWFGVWAYPGDALPLQVPTPPPTPKTGVDGLTNEQARTQIEAWNIYDGVRGFQHILGLTADGVIGPQTTKAVAGLLGNQGYLRPHFHLSEFRCSHCGRAYASPRLLDVLEKMRTDSGQAMGRFSSFRCPQHPIEARKSTPGQHSSGNAWDPNPNPRMSFVRQYDVQGIGYAAADNGRCTHFDTRGGNRVEFVDN